MKAGFTIKCLNYTTETWIQDRKEVLAYDHPNVDYLFIKIKKEDYEFDFLVYDMSERNSGKDGLLYYGDEFPEAICTIL